MIHVFALIHSFSCARASQNYERINPTWLSAKSVVNDLTTCEDHKVLWFSVSERNLVSISMSVHNFKIALKNIYISRRFTLQTDRDFEPYAVWFYWVLSTQAWHEPQQWCGQVSHRLSVSSNWTWEMYSILWPTKMVSHWIVLIITTCLHATNVLSICSPSLKTFW